MVNVMLSYSLYDKKANIYYPPMFVGYEVEAVRQFDALKSNEETVVGKYPDDFELRYVGTFSSYDGVFHPADNIKVIA